MRRKGAACGVGSVILTMRGNPIVWGGVRVREFFCAGEMGAVTCIMLGHSTAIINNTNYGVCYGMVLCKTMLLHKTYDYR